MRPVASGLDALVDIAGMPGDPDRVLVLERAVRVVTVSTERFAPLPFLDLSASVCRAAENGEAPRACLAPDYTTSGHRYVCSTTASTGDSTVTRYTDSTDARTPPSFAPGGVPRLIRSQRQKPTPRAHRVTDQVPIASNVGTPGPRTFACRRGNQSRSRSGLYDATGFSDAAASVSWFCAVD